MFGSKDTNSQKTPEGDKTFESSAGVRTFKDDLKSFESGKTSESFMPDQNISPLEKSMAAPAPEKTFTPPESNQIQPFAPQTGSSPANPFQSVPTPPPISQTGNSSLPPFQSGPSHSFFSENTAPQAPANALPDEKSPSTAKGGRFLAFFTFFFVLLVAAGAGFYYYWFYVKNAIENDSALSPQNQVTENPNSSSDSSQAENKNLRRLVVDFSQGQESLKLAVSKVASEFLASAAENELTEVKILNKENQPVGKKEFFTGFGLVIPETISGKLSEDYSLFLKKEQGVAKMGLVFKTVTSSNLSQEMQKWESNAPSGLSPLYQGQKPIPAKILMSSGKYKNASIRYFNFSSPANTSFDYSIIANFLVIGTSKDSTRSILDYMSEK